MQIRIICSTLNLLAELLVSRSEYMPVGGSIAIENNILFFIFYSKSNLRQQTIGMLFHTIVLQTYIGH